MMTSHVSFAFGDNQQNEFSADKSGESIGSKFNFNSSEGKQTSMLQQPSSNTNRPRDFNCESGNALDKRE